MKERITIDVAIDEFDFVKEAIFEKTMHLIGYLDSCKRNQQHDEFIPPSKPIVKKSPVKRGRPSKLSQMKGKK